MFYINQNSYPDTPYITRVGTPDEEKGKNSTVASSGCGLCAAIMVGHKLLDNFDFSINEAIELSYSVKANHHAGTNYQLFAPAFAEKFGLDLEITDNPEKLISCLKNGGAAVVHCKATENYKAVFTNGGHFVAAVGIENDGRITVLDPSYKEGKYDTPERKGKVEVKDGYISLCDIKILIEDSLAKKPKCFYLFTSKR